MKGNQGKSYLCAVHSGLTDPGSCPAQAPSLVSEGSKPAAHVTVYKYCLASLSLKALGILAQCVSSGISGEKQSCIMVGYFVGFL